MPKKYLNNRIRVHALQEVNCNLIPGIAYESFALPGIIFEHRARSTARCGLNNSSSKHKIH